MKILQEQTLKNGGEESMSLQEDFLASLSPSQVKEKERMITVTSGHTCYGLYKKSDPLGLLVKTLLESSQWFSPARRLKWEVKPLFSEKITEKEYCYDRSMLSKPSVKTLSEKDIPSNRCLFRLVPLEHPTEETGYGLLPTVQTQGLKLCNKNGKTTFYPVELLPTPNAREADKYTKKYNPKSQMGTALTAMAVNGMLPTPTARSFRNGSKPEDGRTKRKMEQGWTMELNDLAACGMLPTPTTNDYKGASTLEALEKRRRNPATNSLADRFSQTGKTSQLNPLFVEEMMGFPLMWTTLPFLSQSGDRNQSKDTETP